MSAYIQAFLEQVLVSVACNGAHSLGESGATRTPFPAQGGQQSGDCGQQVMAP
jgi:hypothetical protein